MSHARSPACRCPLLYTVLLWLSRKALLSGRSTPLRQTVAFLADDYRPFAFYWEPLEMCRKIALSIRLGSRTRDLRIVHKSADLTSVSHSASGVGSLDRRGCGASKSVGGSYGVHRISRTAFDSQAIEAVRCAQYPQGWRFQPPLRLCACPHSSSVNDNPSRFVQV